MPDTTVCCWGLPDGAVRWSSPDGANDVAFSPDGAALAGTDSEGRLLLWRAAGGALAGAWRCRDLAEIPLAFAPDGQRLATGIIGGGVRFWPWREMLRAAGGAR
jgi:hypothetical protein